MEWDYYRKLPVQMAQGKMLMTPQYYKVGLVGLGDSKGSSRTSYPGFLRYLACDEWTLWR